MPLEEKERTFVDRIGKKFFQKKNRLDFSIDSPGNIDFSVRDVRCKDDRLGFFLWAEAKRGEDKDLIHSFIQLILTIGKERPHENFVPPNLLAAFDEEKISFLPYSVAKEFLSLPVEWKDATPSERPSSKDPEQAKQFQQLLKYEQETKVIKSCMTAPLKLVEDEETLREFIQNNFREGAGELQKIQITEANFVKVYERWIAAVKDHIVGFNWTGMQKEDILERNFYLADLMSDETTNCTLTEPDQHLRVTLMRDPRYSQGGSYYEVKMKAVKDGDGVVTEDMLQHYKFDDEGEAHREFWNLYTRPPARDLWEILLNRLDLLVPPNIRELKGAFYTPEIWAAKSKEYLARELGENWQDEYYVWDCSAGTGNLLKGLAHKKNIFASTLDYTDVLVMKQRATPPLSTTRETESKEKLAPELSIFKTHIFQFDFLNDEFEDKKIRNAETGKDEVKKCKLPKDLEDIIKDPGKRKKLIIYINPPYVEVSKIKGGKEGANASEIHDRYAKELGDAGRELYTQFLMRIYREIPDCWIAEFSKLKFLGPECATFRQNFQPKLQTMFVCPSYTFDNATGEFPIGFKIWNCSIKEPVSSVCADVYNDKGELTERRCFRVANNINKWISPATKSRNHEDAIGFLCGTNGSDFQHNGYVYILNRREQMANPRGVWIRQDNIIKCGIYLAVRQCIPKTWLNDRDQFLYPNSTWEEDTDFQYNCLTYTLFHDQNRISALEGINYWIPFQADGEEEDGVGAHGPFLSDSDPTWNIWKFLNRKLPEKKSVESLPDQKLYDGTLSDSKPSIMELLSPKARAVFDAGQELWKYYHGQFSEETAENINASLYDIRAYFQWTRKGEKTKTSRDKKTKEKHVEKIETEELRRINENIKERNTSTYREYKKLKFALDACMEELGKEIEPKVYEHGFLLK